MPALDRTHDPATHSWVDSARRAGTAFPLQNLPLGVFQRGHNAPRIGVAIGDLIVDLPRVLAVGALPGVEPAIRDAAQAITLNHLMALGRPAAAQLRAALHALLREDSTLPRPPEECLVPAAEAELLLPAAIGDYTDFYASIHHATNVGSMFRPDEPLLPNYKWVPIGYHGRASSIVPSGTPVRRPRGQLKEDAAGAPAFRATRALDYECEVGAWVGQGNRHGDSIPIGEAERHLFGLCLLNDWSARDVQRWEYQPLGPFLSKSFATSISPWVVTLDALEPFRVPRQARAAGDPDPLPYLDGPADRERGGFALTLEVDLASERMRREGVAPQRLSRAEFAALYWTMAQLLTHHTSNGCNLRTGDLLGSGTVSGPARENRGCLLELTSRGSEPVSLPTGEQRRFLEDGDEVTLRGTCAAEGFVPIGLGECRGVILPAAE